MSTNIIDVSVIVPLYHGSKYVDGILQMARKNAESANHIKMELVLVNDSPDDVPDIPETDNVILPVYFVSNEANLGIQRARLRGVEHSNGRFLLFLDQDDVIFDNAIGKLFDIAEEGKAAVSDWILEMPCENGISSIEITADTNRFSLDRFCLGGNIVGPPGHCLIDRNCLPVCWKNKIMKINGADDYFLWMGMLAEGCKFAHCAETLYIHKYHDGCFSNDYYNLIESEKEAFGLIADEYGISAFNRLIYRRSLRWRESKYTKDKSKQRSKVIRFLQILFYPEQLLLRIRER